MFPLIPASCYYCYSSFFLSHSFVCDLISCMQCVYTILNKINYDDDDDNDDDDDDDDDNIENERINIFL
jgi:hypothetical protein